MSQRVTAIDVTIAARPVARVVGSGDWFVKKYETPETVCGLGVRMVLGR
jgi:hypothetical protein